MYVKRMKLYGVRGFRFDLPLDGEGELPQATRKRMLLQGSNGSGKTTVLETIAGLWEWFGRIIDDSSSSFRFPDSSRWTAELNAMELGDFPAKGKSFWIAIGNPNGLKAIRDAHPETPLASMVVSGSRSRIELPPGIDWRTSKLRSQEGVEPLPNVVHFPPDNRSPTPPTGTIKRLDLYQPSWLAVYSPKYDLDSLLFTVRARWPERYKEALELVNRMLQPVGKRVASQEGRKSGRLQIEKNDEPRPPAHSWVALSSGERQMLLFVVYTVCLLREHSILLVDEPDLHLHLSMVKQLLQTLDYVCQERYCQLIVSSHSERVWDFFGRADEQIELGGWGGPHP